MAKYCHSCEVAVVMGTAPAHWKALMRREEETEAAVVVDSHFASVQVGLVAREACTHQELRCSSSLRVRAELAEQRSSLSGSYRQQLALRQRYWRRQHLVER